MDSFRIIQGVTKVGLQSHNSVASPLGESGSVKETILASLTKLKDS